MLRKRPGTHVKRARVRETYCGRIGGNRPFWYMTELRWRKRKLDRSILKVQGFTMKSDFKLCYAMVTFTRPCRITIHGTKLEFINRLRMLGAKSSCIRASGADFIIDCECSAQNPHVFVPPVRIPCGDTLAVTAESSGHKRNALNVALFGFRQ